MYILVNACFIYSMSAIRVSMTWTIIFKTVLLLMINNTI